MNFGAGEDVGNAIDIGLSSDAPVGSILVQSIVSTDLVIDVYGYFTDVEELAGFNTALGDRALFNNTTGNFNTATGALALQNNTEGPRNTATGFQALGNNTTGIANTATGFEALLMNLTGQSNTGAGSSALRNNTSGRENTAMGNAALFNNTGNNNTAVGSLALLTSTTGINNIAIGRAAALNVTTGSNNIHIGNQGNNADTALIRIGTGGTHTATFIAGIFGTTVLPECRLWWTATDSWGSLAPSSRRVKDDIRDMDDASGGCSSFAPSPSATKPSPSLARARSSTA